MAFSFFGGIHPKDHKQTRDLQVQVFPEPDIVVTMGCNVVCPHIPGASMQDWGLEDPTGLNDEIFVETIKTIENKIMELKQQIQNME